MDSQKIRTYGKRLGTKRKQDTSAAEGIGTSATSGSTPATSAKRRKVSPQATMRNISPTRTDVDSDADICFPANLAPSKAKGTCTPPRKQVTPLAKPPFPQSQLPAKGAKLARDLSEILDGITPASPSASPAKLAKRMLGRSKTDTSIGSQSTTRESTNIERTPSLPTLPSSPSKIRENIASTSKLAAPVLPPLPSSSKTVTRTYAGQFRSFLVTMSAKGSQTITEEDEFESRESYSSLRSRWDVDNSEDDPYPYASPSPSKSKSNSATPDMSPYRAGKGKSKAIVGVRPPPIPFGMSNPLKSISELRNKGEGRRFMDEVGYLFEGMEKKGGIGLRRASALEITTKLCDPDFARKAKAADFFTRTFDLFLETGAGKGEDKIIDILLVFFVALVSRDPASLLELTQRLPSPPPSPSLSSKRPQKVKEKDLTFFDALFNILSSNPPHIDPLILVAPTSSTSDADLKKAGIKPKDRTLLTTIYKTISAKSSLFPEDSIISTPLLIAFALHVLPPSTIPSQRFPAFLASLRSSLCPPAAPSLTSSLSLRWHDTASAIPYHSIYYHLRLLDTYLLEQWDPQQEESGQEFSQDSSAEEDLIKRNNDEMAKAREEWLADDLVAFTVCVELNKVNDEADMFPARKYMDTALRILVSLTHMDKYWARKVAKGDYTMGLLMRTIYAFGQELEQSKSSLGGMDVKKEEETEDLSEAGDEARNSKADSQALDTLCLGLGLLTNLVQSVDEAKGAVGQIQINPSCPLRKKACGRHCSCSRRSSGIDILAQLYLQQQVKVESAPASLSEDSPEARAEADASFLRGHLAVLFGLLMMGSAGNESAILSALPSSSEATAKKPQVARRVKFARLLDQAREFAAFYSAVSGDVGEEKESKVAGDVVRFLEAKRDATF
ncbi:hypothetical protein BDN70DRAFT_880183 [Pholiota conissans]|uniref:Wings apart-like protein C-terminal domain-containing protein n=1 Tax=Pholiota conissans TaxID=109636 RepID=A0A9P5Z2E5_9AGAR|nr:hypothetical protein BDN70DRAFT_880183 [Pholiota conissans]